MDITFLQNLALLDEIPNEGTLSSMNELDNGGGVSFSESTSALFQELLAES